MKYESHRRLGRREVLARAGAAVVVAGVADLLPLGIARAASPKRGGTFVYANPYPNNRRGDAPTMRHPYFWLDLNTRSTFNALTWVDENLQVQPELATKWEAVSENQKVWEVTVRDDVSFHNGKPMTADDVVASYERHRHPKLGASFARQVVESVEKIGPHKVRFHLKQGDSEFPYVMAEYHLVILPAAAPEQIGLDGIGTGPFMFKDGDPKRRYVLARNPNYWRKGLPHLDGLEVVAQTMEGAMNGYQAGQFDAVLDIDPGLIGQIKKMKDVQISYATSGDQVLMILPKHEGSPFLDKRIRQALSLAIDREAIRRIVYGNDAGWVGNDSHLAAVDPNFLPRPVPRHVEKAKRLLKEAGHPNGITLPTFYFNQYTPELPRVFQVLAESIKEAGITLPIEQRPTDGYRAWRVEDKEKTRKHRFAFGPVGTRNAAISLFRMARPDYNESGYWHPSPEGDRYITLYKKAVVTGDLKARREIYHEMQRILQEEVPAILPCGRRNTAIHRANVHGLRAHPQQWSVRFDEVWKA